MTREERNNKLKHLITCMKCEVSGKCCDENCPTQYDAGNMGEVIENLEEISKILEQEHSEDAISRQAAIKAMDDLEQEDIERYSCSIPEGFDGKRAIEALQKLPSVTQKQKMGRWLEKDGWDGDVYYECSVCGEPFCLIDGTPADNMYNYCPNCGAKMEESEEEIGPDKEG